MKEKKYDVITFVSYNVSKFSDVKKILPVINPNSIMSAKET